MRHLRRPSMALLKTEDTELCGKLCVVYRNYGAKTLLRSQMQSTGAKVANRISNIIFSFQLLQSAQR